MRDSTGLLLLGVLIQEERTEGVVFLLCPSGRLPPRLFRSILRKIPFHLGGHAPVAVRGKGVSMWVRQGEDREGIYKRGTEKVEEQRGRGKEKEEKRCNEKHTLSSECSCQTEKTDWPGRLWKETDGGK